MRAAFSSGRDKGGDFGDVWFLPRFFGCRVCKLRLAGPELELAGIKGMSLRTDEEVDDDWEPDFELM